MYQTTHFPFYPSAPGVKGHNHGCIVPHPIDSLSYRDNWKGGRHKLFTGPDNNCHGLRRAIDLPESLTPIAFALRVRTLPLRNLGAAISPDNSWIFLQGIETLPLRVAKHSENALTVAQYLKKNPKVSWVRYPGLTDDPTYAKASTYLQNGFGGMVVFGVKGGYNAAVKVIDTITLFSHLANVGNAKSLILHPASTSPIKRRGAPKK